MSHTLLMLHEVGHILLGSNHCPLVGPNGQGPCDRWSVMQAFVTKGGFAGGRMPLPPTIVGQQGNNLYVEQPWQLTRAGITRFEIDGLKARLVQIGAQGGGLPNQQQQQQQLPNQQIPNQQQGFTPLDPQ